MRLFPGSKIGRTDIGIVIPTSDKKKPVFSERSQKIIARFEKSLGICPKMSKAERKKARDEDIYKHRLAKHEQDSTDTSSK